MTFFESAWHWSNISVSLLHFQILVCCSWDYKLSVMWSGNMVKFSIESCNCKETKALPVGRRGPINSMGWRVPINSKHVLSWSHLSLKPPSMSHAQPYVRVAHTRRLYTKVWPRHYVPMPFSYITHTHTRTYAHTHIPFVLYLRNHWSNWA